MDIVFAGTPEFALPCLDALFHSHHRLIAVYTQPDRPAGRGHQLQESAVKVWAKTHQIPVYQPLNFKTQEARDTLASLKPHLMVVIAYGLILPSTVLCIPKLGCINVHASLLPRGRGASPIQEAILQGDIETGITVMQMDKGMDTGSILKTQSCPIAKDETSKSLHDKLAMLCVAPLLHVLDTSPSPRPQNEAQATYAPKINKQDAHINWHQSAKVIERQIRAFYPWPIAFTHANDLTIRIHQARVLPKAHHDSPGTIVAITSAGIEVATQDEVLLLEKIQLAGGKVVTVKDWLNAHPTQLKPKMQLS